MKIYECRDDPEEMRLWANHINIIYEKKGHIILPNVEALSMLQILFVESGEFNITAHNKKIVLGNMSSKKVTTLFELVYQSGTPGWDTQPKFIYLPVKESWYILTWGNFIFE